jgi:hypothetical protein
MSGACPPSKANAHGRKEVGELEDCSAQVIGTRTEVHNVPDLSVLEATYTANIRYTNSFREVCGSLPSNSPSFLPTSR